MPFLSGFRGGVDLTATVLPKSPKNEKITTWKPDCEPWEEDADAVKACESLKLDNLAQAVAMAETGGCKEGYGVTHNNCHGIKKGNTVPCQTAKGSKMCRFEAKEESYEAFKTIWSKWYKNNPPTLRDAQKWTGNDRAATWLKNVNYYLK